VSVREKLCCPDHDWQRLIYIEAVPHVKSADPLFMASVLKDPTVGGAMIKGVDIDTAAGERSSFIEEGRLAELDDARLSGIVLGVKLAQQIAVSVGTVITVISRRRSHALGPSRYYKFRSSHLRAGVYELDNTWRMCR